MSRPSLAPRKIPRWAWKRDKWLSKPPADRGPKPGPTKLPAWFWPWRRWLHGTPKTPAAPEQITMYDDVNLALIPADAEAVAGYVNGRWPTYTAVVARWPKAKHLSIAVTAHADADCLDVERGDASAYQAPAWVKRQLERGVKRPVVYTSISEAKGVLAELAREGIRRDQIRLWTAHYTGKSHRCTADCGFGFTGKADATQWTDKALGRSLDETLAAPDFFASWGT